MKDKAIEIFLKNYASSRSTMKAYNSALKSFLSYINMGASEFLNLAKTEPEKAKEFLYNYKEYIVKNKSPKTAHAYISAINAFLEFYNIDIKIKKKGMKSTPISIDYIPTLEEIEFILANVTKDYRTIFGLIAFSGLRPSDVLRLRYKNISDDIIYDSENKLYKAKRVPASIILRQKKTSQWYVTFMGPRMTQIMIDWLNYYYKRLGRPLRLDDPLFPQRSKHTVEIYWYHLLKRLGIERERGIRKLRLYSLRKYFRRAVSKLGEDAAEYLMGHVKGINSLTATYSGLRDLDPEAIEQLRQQFASIVEELEGSSIGTKELYSEVEKLRRELEALKKQNQLLLKLIDEVFMGLPLEDAQKVIDYINKIYYERTQEELGETLEQTFYEALKLSKQLKKKPKAMPTYTNGGRKHVIVKSEEELLEYLEKGYQIVWELRDGKMVLKAPT